VALAPGRILEKAPDAVAIAEAIPVDVVLRVAVGIDHGDELQILAGHHPGVDLTLRLRAAADLRQQHHVARRHEPLTAKDVAGDNRQRRSGTQTFEKRAAIHGGHAPVPCDRTCGLGHTSRSSEVL
jgi:hypothetical protein